LCGRRAAKALDDKLLTPPEVESLALAYAAEDTPLVASMNLYDYVRWFTRGYESHVADYSSR
jgi:hypothetical protein